MAIELAGVTFYTPRDLSDAGIRRFFPAVRIGTESFVSEVELGEYRDLLAQADIETDRFLPLSEAAARIGVSREEFEGLLWKDSLVPFANTVAFENRWYVSGDDLTRLDPRFDTENYVSLHEAAQEIGTSPVLVDELIRPEERWPERVNGEWYVLRSSVRSLARSPRFDKERYISAYEASLGLRVSTDELRRGMEKGRIPGRKVEAEWYLPRETFETLLAQKAAPEPGA
jgi:hypothetical protein